MFAVADVLSEVGDVLIAGRVLPSRDALIARGLPSGYPMEQLTDRRFTSVSRHFDLAVVVTNTVPPKSRAPVSILQVQFPFRISRSLGPLRELRRSRFLANYFPVVYSNYVREWTEHRWHIDSSVVAPPIDRGEYDPSRKEPMILSIGRFSNWFGARKHQDALIDAYRSLPERVRQSWKLVLAGGTEGDLLGKRYLKDLRGRAAGYDIEFAVNVSQDDLTRLKEKASIFWHGAGFGSSDRYPGRAEHFGMATVEAMSFGAVPLVYDGGGQRDIVSEGLGARWSNLSDLVEVTVEFIEDDGLREAVARRAVASSERFSYERFRQALHAVVDAAMKARA